MRTVYKQICQKNRHSLSFHDKKPTIKTMRESKENFNSRRMLSTASGGRNLFEMSHSNFSKDFNQSMYSGKFAASTAKGFGITPEHNSFLLATPQGSKA
mmetsp:Transcript_3056/g.4675  ORF Transcript_3056/g.4675 Transcript_3056/m.4675 type:complete len:99 (+) Transcript_3056:1-297(+)